MPALTKPCVHVGAAVISHYGQDVAGNGGVTQLVPRHPPHNPRTFSPREAARLQGFPDGFVLSAVAGGEEKK